jgi:hypothetical protein
MHLVGIYTLISNDARSHEYKINVVLYGEC